MAGLNDALDFWLANKSLICGFARGDLQIQQCFFPAPFKASRRPSNYVKLFLLTTMCAPHPLTSVICLGSRATEKGWTRTDTGSKVGTTHPPPRLGLHK